MKILFVVSSFPALSETFILNQITGFIDAGHDVSILALKKVKTKAHPDVANYQLMRKVTFISIPQSKLKRSIRAVKSFIKIGVKTPRQAFNLLNSKKYGKFVLSLRPLLVAPFFQHKNPFDGIISHYGSNGLMLDILKKEKCIKSSTPIFSFFHGNDVTGFVKRFGVEIYKPLRDSNIHCLPISKHWEYRLQELQIHNERTSVHHMGVDIQKFPTAAIKPPKDNIELLIIGRLTEKKGIDIAIKAVYLLRKVGLNCKLTIVGNGELKRELQELVSDLCLGKSVAFSGWVDQSHIQVFIREADIIIQPSKTATNGDQEGIPVSLMEALASGKLVISTWHSGIPELIRHNYNGWLVHEGDEKGLAHIIHKVTTLPLEEKKNISKNARLTIARDFNIDILNQQLIKRIECANEK